MTWHPYTGPLYGYPILPDLMPGGRLQLVGRNRLRWHREARYGYAQPPFPSDLPAPMQVYPLILAGDAPPVSSPWGWRRDPTGDGVRMHEGVDLAIPVGTPVYAPSSGAVVERAIPDDGNAAGTRVYVRTPDGYRWAYFHLSAILHPAGSVVDTDTPIALSGDSGRVTGPHLHFAAWDPSGRNVDPVSLFPPGTFGPRR